jgi:hypothetical protein
MVCAMCLATSQLAVGTGPIVAALLGVQPTYLRILCVIALAATSPVGLTQASA